MLGSRGVGLVPMMSSLAMPLPILPRQLGDGGKLAPTSEMTRLFCSGARGWWGTQRGLAGRPAGRDAVRLATFSTHSMSLPRSARSPRHPKVQMPVLGLHAR